MTEILSSITLMKITISELQRLKTYLDGGQDEYSGGFTFEFDGNELNVLIEAMENFSQPSFTKDREMSRIARTNKRIR